jgi:hypothetical protein
MNRTSVRIDGVENINGKLQFTGASPSSYQQTCRDIGADGDTLFATCRQVDGNYQRTSMPIPGIENNNGNLRHL